VNYDEAWELWLYDESGEETLLDTASAPRRMLLSSHTTGLYDDGGWVEFRRVRNNEGVIYRRRKWFRWQYRMYIFLPAQQLMYGEGD
jgi:hypothetical protein